MSTSLPVLSPPKEYTQTYYVAVLLGWCGSGGRSAAQPAAGGRWQLLHIGGIQPQSRSALGSESGQTDGHTALRASGSEGKKAHVRNGWTSRHAQRSTYSWVRPLMCPLPSVQISFTSDFLLLSFPAAAQPSHVPHVPCPKLSPPLSLTAGGSRLLRSPCGGGCRTGGYREAL